MNKIKKQLEFKDQWIDELKFLNISKKDYINTKNILFKRFGKNPSENDIIWSLLNNVLLNNITDYEKLYHIYYIIGNIVRKEGRNDPNLYYELSSKSILRYYKNLGYKRVTYVASLGTRTCNVCSKLDGKHFDINDVLKNPPVPNKKCKNKDENGYINCRCAIVALKDDQ